jgi:hypothetical protein
MVNRRPPKRCHDTQEWDIDAYFHDPVRHFLDTFPGVMIKPRDKPSHYGNPPFMDRRDSGFVVPDLILPFMRIRQAFLVKGLDGQEYEPTCFYFRLIFMICLPPS